jgi:hypothetical protein
LSVPSREPLQSSPEPSSSLPARSPSPQEPYDNSGEVSSSDHDDDIPPNSPQQPLATEPLLTVYFGTPNMFITLWFGLVYGANPPLGTLII